MRIRGFEVSCGYENKDVVIPRRETLYSAGYDIAAIETVEIKPQDIVLVSTGLKAYMPEDEVLKIYLRSSIPKKKGLLMANSVGIIDSDYYNNENNDGHIMIPLYNFSKRLVIINKGEKIAQGIFTKYLLIDNDNPNNQIRKGGFGSSDEF
jgi:dUTP pyrophosphatase